MSNRPLVITWPYAVIVLIILSLALVGTEVVSAARAYVGGEGHWSKAERDAVALLIRYGDTRQAADHQAFLDALVVPLGDRAGRESLERDPADPAVAYQGFLAGRNHPDDIPGMIRLFRLFKDVPVMRRAIDLWTQGDEWVARLADVGERLHAEVTGPAPDDLRVRSLVAEAVTIHEAIAPLEDRFSATLNEISRLVTRAVHWTLSGGALLLLLVGMTIAHRIQARTGAISLALQQSERRAQAEKERAQVTLRAIGDAVLSTDPDGAIDYLNAAAEQLTGWPSDRALGRPLEDVVRVGPIEHSSVAHGSATQPAGGVGWMLTRADGSLVSVDQSEAPIRDRDGNLAGKVVVLRDVTQERALAQQLRHQASHDGLTGLANRRHFEQRLRHVLAAPGSGAGMHAVLYMDLDQFKVVNDTCGHPAGDELIRQVGSRVRDMLRRGDTLARLGGDEFGVLLEHCGADDALRTAEAIRRDVAQFRFAWEGRTFAIGASIGVVMLDETMATVAAVMSAADRACYAAKDNGRDRVHLFRLDDREMQARTGEMEWVARITRALEDDRLVLHSQEIRPLAAAAGGSGLSPDSHLELLVRIIDDDGRLVPPMAFIPAAERYGLMPRIDRWVIARAFTELRELHDRAGAIPRCLINLSGSSVADPALLDFIAAQFARSGLPCDRIGFELTETAAVTNLTVAVQLMRSLRALGCPLALDDFGSGMSSFAYLRSMPIDYLKIDGHIVKDLLDDPVDRAMVRSIQQIAQVLGVHTIAEWVEDNRLIDELGRLGIDYVQGYVIARPMQLAVALDEWQQRRGTTALPPDAAPDRRWQRGALPEPEDTTGPGR